MSQEPMVSPEDIALIRLLDDKDLATVIARINDGGWGDGRTKLYRLMRTRKYKVECVSAIRESLEGCNERQSEDQS